MVDKLGKSTEAQAAIKEALLLANTTGLHQFGRKLLSEKKNKEVLELFKMNDKKIQILLLPLWV